MGSIDRQVQIGTPGTPKGSFGSHRILHVFHRRVDHVDGLLKGVSDVLGIPLDVDHFFVHLPAEHPRWEIR